jgi:uncharacterized membrane protein (UPF0182 family)
MWFGTGFALECSPDLELQNTPSLVSNKINGSSVYSARQTLANGLANLWHLFGKILHSSAATTVVYHISLFLTDTKKVNFVPFTCNFASIKANRILLSEKLRQLRIPS